MAGAGYKLFQTGDVLTAQQVNEYLQQQVTMVFADSAARTTALSGVLAEGMMSYLQDTNLVEVYDGSSWVSVGNTGDITAVTAGTGLTGGGTSGAVTLTNDMAVTITAKGDLVAGTGNATYDNLPAGTNEHRLVADSGQTTGLKYVADTTNYAIAAKGDLLVGTAADTLSALSVGTNGHTLVANSSTSTGLEWAAVSSGSLTLLNSGGTSLSGSSTSVSALDQSYEHLLIVVRGGVIGSSVNAFWRIQLDGDTGSNYLAMYRAGGRTDGGSIATRVNYTTYFKFLGDDLSQNTCDGFMWVYNYSKTDTRKEIFSNAFGTEGTFGANSSVQTLDGAYVSTNAVDSVDLIISSGSFSAGKIYVYGVK